MYKPGQAVVVSKAISFSGAPSSLQGLKGHLEFVSVNGRVATFIPDGEQDEFWVFTRELDSLPQA